MLVVLGFTMVLTFMALIMTHRLTPLVALIIVPTIFGLFAGAGLGLGEMILDALRDLAPTAALLMFAIMYFGIMINTGLFDPLVRLIVRALGDDPAAVVLGTAILAAIISLDGDGSTTFIVTTAAMLPIYLRLGMSPVVLTCVAGLANGTLNILPWGGPTARAAAALNVSPGEVFVPMIPSMLAGLALTCVFAWFLGLAERNRLGGSLTLRGSIRGPQATGRPVPKTLPRNRQEQLPTGTIPLPSSAMHEPPHRARELNPSLADTVLDPERESLRPGLFWFNLLLTAGVLGLLISDAVPLAYVFLVGSGIALIVNFPQIRDQQREIVAHASSIVGVVSLVLAAGVLIGVMSGTGMVQAMSSWLVAVIPDALGPFLAIITGLISIPMTFFLSNDAFYFGILPVLAESAANYGITPAEMARASITGQPVHMQSPLVPAILLLVSLAQVGLGEHHKKTLWRACAVSLLMLLVGVLLQVIPLGGHS